MDDDNVVRIVQYKQPSLWTEAMGYAAAVVLFGLTVLQTANVIPPLALTAMLMYWNYKLFGVIREYVKQVNASEMSRLLTLMAEDAINKQKDGTFQDSDSLTKEQEGEGQRTERD